MSKFAIITGGSRGIGLATAKYFLKHGAEVLIVSNSGSMDFEDINLTYVQLDLTDDSAVDEFVRSIKAFGRPIDFLVNNPSLLMDPSGQKTSLGDILTIMQSNLASIIKLTDGLVDFIESKGAIVNVESSGSMRHSSIEKASKRQIESYSNRLSQDLSEKQIIVHSVDPIWSKTNLDGQTILKDLDEVAREIYELTVGNT